MKRVLLLTALLGGLTGARALELRSEILGTLKIKGALTGYGIYSSNRTDDKKTRYDVGSALMEISKPAEPLGFTLIGGAYAVPVVGLSIRRTADSTGLFSPLPVAYLEYAPIKGVSLQAGKLPTIIGRESAFTYLNNYLQRGLVWNMQPVVHHGVRFNYAEELFSFKVGVNDGFYTLSEEDAKPALEGSLGFKPTKEGSLSFNFLIPAKNSRPNKTAYPANRREFNLLTSYSIGKSSVGFELTYAEAPRDAEARVPVKARALGGALHLSYELKPSRFSGRVEYVDDESDRGGIDLVGLGDGNKAWTLTLAHSYTRGYVFVRGELSYVHAKERFTLNNRKNQTRAGIELGFLF